MAAWLALANLEQRGACLWRKHLTHDGRVCVARVTQRQHTSRCLASRHTGQQATSGLRVKPEL